MVVALITDAVLFSGCHKDDKEPVFFSVATETDLRKVGTGKDGWTISANYKLTANITLDLPPEAGESNWTPIAISDEEWNLGGFTGTFDGNGHIISGITVNNPHKNPQGMFSYVGAGGVVKNLNLVNATINGGDYVGGVAGKNSSGTIKNCSFSGNITGSGFAGGVAGYNGSGIVENCFSAGYVLGFAGAGGVVGNNNIDGIVRNCYSIGSVGGSRSVGGVVADNFSIVENCFSTGNVSGVSGDNFRYGVGGITGSNGGIVKNCYATGNISGSGLMCHVVGGIVGINGSAVENCYATGNISAIGGDDVYAMHGTGGIVGNNHFTTENPHIVRNCITFSPNVTGIQNTGRIVGYIWEARPVTLSNNKARSDMPGIWNNKIIDAKDGADVEINTPMLSVFSNWDVKIWIIPSGNLTIEGNLPTLRNMPETAPQNPKLPKIIN